MICNHLWLGRVRLSNAETHHCSSRERWSIGCSTFFAFFVVTVSFVPSRCLSLSLCTNTHNTWVDLHKREKSIGKEWRGIWEASDVNSNDWKHFSTLVSSIGGKISYNHFTFHYWRPLKSIDESAFFIHFIWPRYEMPDSVLLFVAPTVRFINSEPPSAAYRRRLSTAESWENEDDRF